MLPYTCWAPHSSGAVLCGHICSSPLRQRLHPTLLASSSPRSLQVLWFVDFFCACYFAFCFLLNLWLSDARYAYIMSWHTLVDILTIIPPLVLAFVRLSSVTRDLTTAAAINFLRVLR